MATDAGAYVWRKYGEKIIGGVSNALTRSYFRCAVLDCTAKKRVDREVHAAADEEPIAVRHIGQHNHGGTETSQHGAGLPSTVPATQQQHPVPHHSKPTPLTTASPPVGQVALTVEEATHEHRHRPVPKEELVTPRASPHEGLSSARAEDIAAALYKDLHTLYSPQAQSFSMQQGLPSPHLGHDCGIVPAKCLRPSSVHKRAPSTVDSAPGEVCPLEAHVSSSGDVALVPDAACAAKRARVASNEPRAGPEGGLSEDSPVGHQGAVGAAEFAVAAYPVSSCLKGAQCEDPARAHHLQGLATVSRRPGPLHSGQVLLYDPKVDTTTFPDLPPFSGSLVDTFLAETKAVSARYCYKSLLQPKRESCIEEEASWMGRRESGSMHPPDSGPWPAGDSAEGEMDDSLTAAVSSYSPFVESDATRLRRANEQALDALRMGAVGLLGHSFTEARFDQASSIVDLPALALDTGCHNLLMELVPQSSLNQSAL